jgi:divalent metal cation (Fe/Co/Zn/Cd) transporter
MRSMPADLKIPAADKDKDIVWRIRRIQVLTIAWMSIEAALSLLAAWMARSPSLLAFGGDSAIELISAIVVWRRFRTHSEAEQAEAGAARITGALLFALAAYVIVASALTLFGHKKPAESYLGIAVLIAAAVLMPLLAKEKRRLAAVVGSASLRADAAESALCGYLSLIALAGLAVNAVWHVTWADPVAAIFLVPFILREAWEAVRGDADACCR